MESVRGLLMLMCLSFYIVASGCGGGGDNSVSSTGSGPYAISGFVQKGPFISGSSITIQELDDDLEPTGTSYETTTTDDFGTFSLGSQIKARYIEVIATGFFFDEIIGYLSMANLTLRAIADLSTQEDVNVNILTTLEKDRIKHLVTNEGLTFSEARIQAESEILEIFHIYDNDLSNFSEMDISQAGDSNAILLAISAIILSGNSSGEESESAAELSQFISYLNLDIKDDGILDSDSLIDQLTIKVSNLNLYRIRENLENLYESIGLEVTIPNFEDFIDSDNDGTINLYDDYDDTIDEDFINSAPENVTSYPGHQKAQLSWDSLSDAVAYKIYWSTSSGVSKTNYEGMAVQDSGTWIETWVGPDIDATFIPDTSYTQDELMNGTPYYFVVTGVHERGYESLESEDVTVTPSPAEGTLANPFYLGIYNDTNYSGEDYQGHVDNTASYYRADSIPGGWWIYLEDLTDDVDLYVYEDPGFSVLLNSSTKSGTEYEICNLMGDDSTRYIKVDGSKTAGGADFIIDIQP